MAPATHGIQVDQLGTVSNDNDSLSGGDGDDLISSGSGDVTIDGGTGFDQVFYTDNSGKVEIDLGAGTAKQFTSTGTLAFTDTLANVEAAGGTVLADILSGTASGDLFTGYLGDDTINGGGGTDTLDYSLRSTAIDAELSVADASGNSTVALASGEVDYLNSVEIINGSNQDDTIRGTSGSDNFGGGAGDDTLIGKDGDDTINGGAGDDTLIGGTDGAAYCVNDGSNTATASNDGSPEWSADTGSQTSKYLVRQGSHPTDTCTAKIYYVADKVAGAPEALFPQGTLGLSGWCKRGVEFSGDAAGIL